MVLEKLEIWFKKNKKWNEGEEKKLCIHTKKSWVNLKIIMLNKRSQGKSIY